MILQEIRRPAPSYGTSGDSPARGYPCRAAELLGELGPAAAPAVPALTRILQSPKPDRMRADPRRDVAWALARMGASARSAAPALEAVLEEEHGLGFNSALALWLVGDASQREKALAAVEGFLERGDYWNPYYAVRALAMAGREARHALPLLVATLDWYKAGEALQVFGVLSIDAAPAVPDLVERLESPWGRKRRNAAKALCAIGPAAAAAVPALTLALADRRPDVRAAAARALGPIGEQAGSAVTSLIPLLVGDDEAVSAAAAAGLVGIGGSAVESLLLLYAEAHPVAVNRAGDVLRRIELLHGTAVPALLARAAGKDEALRGPAMVLLTQMGEAAVSGLGIALENEDSRIRLQAAMELRRIGTAAKPAVPALAKAIQGDDERLAAAARDALCATGMAGIDALLSLLKDQNAVVRRLAAEGLGRWAHLRSVSEGLEKRLDDSDPAVANAVRDAIREGNRKGR